MIYIYKKNLKNQLSHLLFVIGGFFTLIIGYLYFYLKYGDDFSFETYMLVIYIYIIYLIPALFLHFEYLKIDKKTILEFDEEKELYIYNNSHTLLKFRNENINKITMYKDKAGWFSTSSYFYLEIELKKVLNPIIITSFIAEKMPIEKERKKNIIIKYRLIPSPFLEKFFKEKQ